jgi:hypothetical protein
LEDVRAGSGGYGEADIALSGDFSHAATRLAVCNVGKITFSLHPVASMLSYSGGMQARSSRAGGCTGAIVSESI